MSDTHDWIIRIEESGGMREFDAASLPVSIGAADDDDIRLAGVTGSLQIGALDSVYFLQATRNTLNVRVNGEPLTGSRRLSDGDEIAFDTARLRCAMPSGRLTIAVDAQVTAGDTAPPDLEDLARAGTAGDDEVAITPISFKAAAVADVERPGFRPSKRTIRLSAAFAVLAILAWFAFTGKSVEFVSTPPIEELDLPSTWFKVRIGDRYLLRSGRHRVTGEVEGYYPLDTEVEVGGAIDQTIELELRKLPGLVTITTEPPTGVSVFVDGRAIGEAPFTDYEIDPGEHTIEFRLPRHFRVSLDIDVRGARARQAVSATLRPNWAPVSLSSRPASAQVFVDGEPVGESPLELELEEGTHTLGLRLNGYNAWTDEIDVVAGEPIEIPLVTLVEADGRVRLVSEPPAATVSVNGEFEGRTPLELRLRPGRTHTIVLAKPGFESVSTELSVAADSGRTVSLELPAQFGQVEVVSEPPAAEIFVDDERVGVTPTNLTLSALPHTVEVRLEGYATQRSEITPRPGREHALSFDLERLNELSGSGYPSVITTSLGGELRLIPAGDFTMGTSRREAGRRSNEILRDVSLTRAFYLGVTEVTNAEFRALRPDHDSGAFAGESLDGDEQPVVNVSWPEVAQFLNALSIRDGLQPVYEERSNGWFPVRPLRNGYRLPTEAEWAWAARFAGQEQPLVFPWGEDPRPPDRSGNYADISAMGILPTTLVTYNDGFTVSAPVGSFERNAAGIHDLGGNVAEWVQDFYLLEYESPTEVLVDPLGPETGSYHMIRGSSWKSATTADLRVAYRAYSSDGREDLGFRIARNLE